LTERALTNEERLEDFRLHAAACRTCRDPSAQQAFALEELCDVGRRLWMAYVEQVDTKRKPE